jgi:hypothetical protein
MDGAREFLEDLRRRQLTAGRFLALLNTLIGRRVARADGTVLCSGLTWREVAQLLKRLRWDKEAVTEIGLDPAALPPRDRERFWYTAISQAGVASPAATQAGDEFAQILQGNGYVIGPAPGQKA